MSLSIFRYYSNISKSNFERERSDASNIVKRLNGNLHAAVSREKERKKERKKKNFNKIKTGRDEVKQ